MSIEFVTFSIAIYSDDIISTEDMIWLLSLFILLERFFLGGRGRFLKYLPIPINKSKFNTK